MLFKFPIENTFAFHRPAVHAQVCAYTTCTRYGTIPGVQGSICRSLTLLGASSSR